MSSRYTLRSQQPARLVRRLSPTAVRHTGPLWFPGTLEETSVGQLSLSDMPDPEPHDGRSTSTNTAAMPTEMDVDAAEPMAGGNVGFSRNDSYVESSLTSSSPHVDERRDVNTVDPVLDSTDNHDTGTHYHHVAMETEDPFTEARSCLTDMERETSLGKGKGVDPRNWGGISLDDPEMDPQIQQDMLTEFNA
ncbi:hypothetical protein C0995_002806 [Termitomyces sp. Mi166|nr:hypothetical protein C0995_002806 [Termitomyces sp. Mi166\